MLKSRKPLDISHKISYRYNHEDSDNLELNLRLVEVSQVLNNLITCYEYGYHSTRRCEDILGTHFIRVLLCFCKRARNNLNAFILGSF